MHIIIPIIFAKGESCEHDFWNLSVKQSNITIKFLLDRLGMNDKVGIVGMFLSLIKKFDTKNSILRKKHESG